MPQTAVYALAIVVFIVIIPASGWISSRFLQLFLKALLIVLTGYAASAGKQRCVRQLCIICKRLITLSQIRLLYKKQIVATRQGFTTKHYSCQDKSESLG
ncbi:hypothetical protein [Desulfosarcina sp. BuS5]|uniref:hypothetical protein n=1 Tax=Desulfosarcina sp. BuS5 TaxID=933262 RepID=UPI00047F04A6|nr:hypothetical protein [Desulfosarcina sp. BuS5]